MKGEREEEASLDFRERKAHTAIAAITQIHYLLEDHEDQEEKEEKAKNMFTNDRGAQGACAEARALGVEFSASVNLVSRESAALAATAL